MKLYRHGRKNHRTIYLQVGSSPDTVADQQVGTMDTPELGRLVVDLLNDNERRVNADREHRREL